MNGKEMKVIIWGSADVADRFYEFMEPSLRDKDVEIVGIVDDRYSGYYRVYRILSPEECSNLDSDYVLFLESSIGLDIGKIEERLGEHYR